MKILTVSIALFIMGCATTTALTEEESAICKGNVTCLTEALDQKTYQTKHDSEARRIERRENIVAQIQACLNSGNVITQVTRGSARLTKSLIDRHGVIHLPRNATMLDYSCSTSTQVADSLRRGGLTF